MKKIIKLILSLSVSITMAFTMITGIFANDEESRIIGELISYYAQYQDGATTDIYRLVDELKEVNANTGEAWEKIMNYWIYVNKDMVVNRDVVPDGLINDNSLCFVVLGFQLNPDGTMKDELIGRLSVALASAKKYPNAYVACTGGGTATNNPDATEADLMAEWLIANGLSADRIIVENKSKSTVENAKFTYAILRSTFPQIKSIAMITSDYHIPRGCVLYNSQLLLSAYEAGDQLLSIVSNAGYTTGTQGYESFQLQANGVSQIAGVKISQEDLPLSMLENLMIEGTSEYKQGEALNLKVIASYDSGYKRDVTKLADISGYDINKLGKQTVKAVYLENDIEKTAEFEINVSLETNPDTPTKDEIKTAVKTGDCDCFDYTGYLGALIVSLGIFVISKKRIFN